MYAIIRSNRMDPDKTARAGRQLAEFDQLHASQRGYLGTLSVDAGRGETLVVNLWRSQEDAQAALPVMGPAVMRLLAPLMAGESKLLAAGPVVSDSLVGAAVPAAP